MDGQDPEPWPPWVTLEMIAGRGANSSAVNCHRRALHRLAAEGYVEVAYLSTKYRENKYVGTELSGYRQLCARLRPKQATVETVGGTSCGGLVAVTAGLDRDPAAAGPRAVAGRMARVDKPAVPAEGPPPLVGQQRSVRLDRVPEALAAAPGARG